MKLIGSLASPFTRKARIVLAEKKIEYELEIDSPWDAGTRVPDRNPLGKVPVLVLDDGTTLFDSRVIVEFLDNASPLSRLLPSGNRERIEVRRWEALADGVLDAAVLVRMERRRKPAQQSVEWTERQLGKVRAGLAAMNADLGDQAWCAGNSYTVADIAAGVCLAWLDFRFPDLAWREQQPNLAKLLAKLSERPSFVETVPRE
jgi:glutathione S-transferase